MNESPEPGISLHLKIHLKVNIFLYSFWATHLQVPLFRSGIIYISMLGFHKEASGPFIAERNLTGISNEINALNYRSISIIDFHNSPGGFLIPLERLWVFSCVYIYWFTELAAYWPEAWAWVMEPEWSLINDFVFTRRWIMKWGDLISYLTNRCTIIATNN